MVIELKTGEFKPEYAGQLNFYLSAVDGILKKEQDNPSIGLLLCKSKNNVVAEYSLKDISKPRNSEICAPETHFILFDDVK